MNPYIVTRTLTLSGYFGLWILLPLWYGWLAPSDFFPAGMAIAFLCLPLVFPLMGLVKGKIYTHQWSAYVSLLYFMHGIGETYCEPDQILYGVLEIMLSLMWFCGAIYYPRYSAARNND